MKLFRKLRKPRFLLVYPIAAWLVIVAHTTEVTLRVGIVIALVGEGIRLWANGYVGHVKVNWTEPRQGQPKIGRLITAGPYAFIRHPLYFGTFLIGIGFFIIVGNVWAALVAAIGLVVVYRQKMEEEEATLRHEWGEEFARYQQAVPRWFPTCRRYPHRYGQWGWDGIRASRELKTLSWIVVGLIALYFREELIQKRQPLLDKHGFKHLGLVGLALGLAVGDGLFELARLRAKRRVITRSQP